MRVRFHIDFLAGTSIDRANMAAEWQLGSRGACFERASQIQSARAIQVCGWALSRIWFARPSEIMGRQPSPHPSTDWSSYVTLIPLADRYFWLPAQSTIMFFNVSYYPKKSLFCFSVLLFFCSSSAFTIHAETTRQSGCCPPTLAAHFPGSITAVEQLRESLACFLPI